MKLIKEIQAWRGFIHLCMVIQIKAKTNICSDGIVVAGYCQENKDRCEDENFRDMCPKTCGVCTVVTTQSTTVRVSSGPSITIPATWIEYNEGQTVNLLCLVSPMIGLTDLYWEKDSNKLDTTNVQKYKDGSKTKPNLQILLLSARDAGKYSCTATNSVGKTTGGIITLKFNGPNDFTCEKPIFCDSKMLVICLKCNRRSNTGFCKLSFRDPETGTKTEYKMLSNNNTDFSCRTKLHILEVQPEVWLQVELWTQNLGQKLAQVNQWFTHSCIGTGWGMNCIENCHCLNRDYCLVHSTCKASCLPGWRGEACLQECLDGKFGQNCQKSCHCLLTNDCDKTDGKCHSGCAPGWMGETCQQECPHLKFGPNCDSDCPVSCKDKDCDRNTGECLHGCLPGWKNKHCQQPDCSNKSYCGNHTCHELPHNYKCICKKGYENADAKHCVDIDECLVEDICGIHTCKNLKGAYECICKNESYEQVHPTFCLITESDTKEGDDEFVEDSFFVREVTFNAVIEGGMAGVVLAFIIGNLVLCAKTVVVSAYRFATTESCEEGNVIIVARRRDIRNSTGSIFFHADEMSQSDDESLHVKCVHQLFTSTVSSEDTRSTCTTKSSVSIRNHDTSSGSVVFLSAEEEDDIFLECENVESNNVL